MPDNAVVQHETDQLARKRHPAAVPLAPLVTVRLIPPGHIAQVCDGKGQTLELPIAAWTEVLARIEIALADAVTGTPRASVDFGPAPGRVGPGRHGANWSAHELAQLAKAFRAGQSVAALALAHQRTTGAVEGQLCRLGLMRARERQYGGPWSDPDQVNRKGAGET